jgi:hypothetical protein
MRNPSHDERISSFLDDALPAAERSAFEAELRHNAELKQQVAELRQLRADVAQLPRYSVTEGFAQRVVAAAVAAKADENANISPASRSQPVRLKTIGRGVITGLAIAASIAILMISLPWLNFDAGPTKIVVNDNKHNNSSTVGSENVAIAAEHKPFEIVWSSLPGKDQAMVIRIRAPKDFAAGKALREALAEQGIEKRQPGDRTLAARVGKAYRDQLPPTQETQAADALYLEISRDELDLALRAIAKPESKLEFAPGELVAVSQPVAVKNPNEAAAEDTGEPQVSNAAAPTTDFVQELNPRNFKLPKFPSVAKATGPVAPHGADGKAKVRVLILVEAAE